MDIEQLIDSDLRWREAELVSMKALAWRAESDPGTPRHQALLRACWLLLYAHYEGFCKYSWDVYMEKLESMCIERRKLTDDLLCISSAKMLQRIKSTDSRPDVRLRMG
jgi:hypothetical protein